MSILKSRREWFEFLPFLNYVIKIANKYTVNFNSNITLEILYLSSGLLVCVFGNLVMVKK